MQDPPPDLPSLSATCPTNTNDPPAKATINGHSDTISPATRFPDTQTHPISKPLNPKSRELLVRAAKKELAAKVREDWTWPPTSPHMQSPFIDAEEDNIQWRERDSDSEYSPPSPISDSDPYRFDTPESLTQAPLSKKRKQQLRLEEEMELNEGLRTFVERRDVWAGAGVRPSPNQSDPPDTTDTSSSTHQTTPTSISSMPTPPPPPTTSQHPPQPASPTTFLPLAPPILPSTHPIRASITPQTYPQIYDRVILGGQSPSISINLSDITNALVAGWKKDGEWPPKSEVVPGVGDVSARRLARRGVGRVKRVLGLGRGEGGGAG